MVRIWVLAGIVLILFGLPVRVRPKQLLMMAFSLWILGGLSLTYLGFTRMMMANETDAVIVAAAIALAMAIGWLKGRFILAKTARRNIERLKEMTERSRLFQVYNMRSWIIIALMIGLSIFLNVSNALPVFWRGVVNLAIGFSLISSSLFYVKAGFTDALDSNMEAQPALSGDTPPNA